VPHELPCTLHPPQPRRHYRSAYYWVGVFAVVFVSIYAGYLPEGGLAAVLLMILRLVVEDALDTRALSQTLNQSDYLKVIKEVGEDAALTVVFNHYLSATEDPAQEWTYQQVAHCYCMRNLEVQVANKQGVTLPVGE